MVSGRSKGVLALLLVAVLASSQLGNQVAAKMVHGEIQLGSVNTERYLTKFAADKGAELKVEAVFVALQSFWEKRHSVELDIFTEEGFKTFKTKLDKGSLCDDRVKHAHKRIPVAPRLRSDVKPSRPRVEVNIDWTNEGGSQIFYLYVTDCALEWYNAKGLPPIFYDLEIQTQHLGHLPSDEWGLLSFNLLASVVLSGLFFLLLLKCKQAYARQKQIHLAVLILCAAYALQVVSLFCEALHLIVYNYNGKGLRWRYTFFALDFVSEIGQGASEHLVALLLIFLACGWTTASLQDVVQTVSTTMAATSAGGSSSKDMDVVTACLQSASRLMGHPKVKKTAKALAKQLSSPGTALSKVSLGGVFVVVLTVVNLGLEMWGRQYHDEFGQFHDHEHWPGKCIIVLRVLLWVVFVSGLRMTFAACKSGSDLRSSMAKIGAAGSVFFLSFPACVLLADALPPRLRHRFVEIGSVVLQMAALEYLSMTFMKDRLFARISSIADPRKAQTLPSEASSSSSSLGTTGKPRGRRRSFKVAYD